MNVQFHYLIHDFDQFENNIDMNAYERICNEFKVPLNTNWRCKTPNGKYTRYGDLTSHLT